MWEASDVHVKFDGIACITLGHNGNLGIKIIGFATNDYLTNQTILRCNMFVEKPSSNYVMQLLLGTMMNHCSLLRAETVTDMHMITRMSLTALTQQQADKIWALRTLAAKFSPVDKALLCRTHSATTCNFTAYA